MRINRIFAAIFCVLTMANAYYKYFQKNNNLSGGKQLHHYYD